ncbi:unnamed protein product, partial [Urochloa humidicola]
VSSHLHPLTSTGALSSSSSHLLSLPLPSLCPSRSPSVRPSLAAVRSGGRATSGSGRARRRQGSMPSGARRGGGGVLRQWARARVAATAGSDLWREEPRGGCGRQSKAMRGRRERVAAAVLPYLLRNDSMVMDMGPPADWVKINVRRTKDCYEVYALVPGLLLEEVHVQSDPAGRLIVTGEPEQLDNPWGVTPFKKVISLRTEASFPYSLK